MNINLWKFGDNMNYIEARYLKHCGKKIQVKVSIQTIDGRLEIHIRDSVFYDFRKAMHYLRFIAETELVGTDLEK